MTTSTNGGKSTVDAAQTRGIRFAIGLGAFGSGAWIYIIAHLLGFVK